MQVCKSFWCEATTFWLHLQVQGGLTCLVNLSGSFQRHPFPAVMCPCTGSRAWGAKGLEELSLALPWDPTRIFRQFFQREGICFRDAQPNISAYKVLSDYGSNNVLKSERTRVEASSGVKDSSVDVLESLMGISPWGRTDLHFAMTHSLGLKTPTEQWRCLA